MKKGKQNKRRKRTNNDSTLRLKKRSDNASPSLYIISPHWGGNNKVPGFRSHLSLIIDGIYYKFQCAEWFWIKDIRLILSYA